MMQFIFILIAGIIYLFFYLARGEEILNLIKGILKIIFNIIRFFFKLVFKFIKIILSIDYP